MNYTNGRNVLIQWRLLRWSAVVFSFLKGLNISAIFILPVVIVLLVLLKRQFIREQASYTLGQMIFAAALFIIALLTTISLPALFGIK
ncbi:hypothetical protein [Bacillus velezensis]|uniref:hypothetical protein n=1 Tax=Bacillus velezensis TaxID=492670 RepID=UPI003C6C1C93